MNLNQVTIPSRDVEAAVAFYEKLGLKLIVKAGEHYARFVCPDGNSSFSVHKVNRLPGADGVLIYFEQEELDKYVEALLEKGFEFDQLPKDEPWLWREARLKDPDGNQLVIYYAGENRLNPPWRLNPD